MDANLSNFRILISLGYALHLQVFEDRYRNFSDPDIPR